MFIGVRTLSAVSIVFLGGMEVAALSFGHGSMLNTVATRALTRSLPPAAAAEPAAQTALVPAALDLQQVLVRRLAANTRDDISTLDSQVADEVIRIETWFYTTSATASPAHRHAAAAWTEYRTTLAAALALARAGRVSDADAAASALNAELRQFLVALAADE